MVALLRPEKIGIPKTTPMASCTVAATSVNLHTVGANRTSRIVKLHIHNRNAANTFVQIGTGITPAFVQALNDIECIAGMDLEVTDEALLGVEFQVNTNITVQATVAAVAPNDVLVQAEVTEYLGTSG